jgi:hypothetical protein
MNAHHASLVQEPALLRVQEDGEISELLAPQAVGLRRALMELLEETTRQT